MSSLMRSILAVVRALLRRKPCNCALRAVTKAAPVLGGAHLWVGGTGYGAGECDKEIGLGLDKVSGRAGCWDCLSWTWLVACSWWSGSRLCWDGGVGHSPNLPYSEGIGSPPAAIPVLKVVQREKLSRGKLKCTAGAPFKTPMTVHFH